MTSGRDLVPAGYSDLLADLKERVRATAFRAARAANTEVLRLYWSIGKELVDRRDREDWGTGTLERLAADLRRAFPDQRGWSGRSLRYMRAMAEAWPDDAIWQQPVARLPWGHVTMLLSRLDTREERDWYAARAAEEGWTRGVLELQIRSRLRDSLGAAPTNFTAALDSPDSDLAQQLVKDPYVFEHLALVKKRDERAVEQALMDRLQDTLLEFGRGMAFVGRQVRLTVPDDASDRVSELYIDMLLFSTAQLRYVVVELKVSDFEPAFISQIGTYVAIVDDQYRDPAIHAPTIGILLCTGKANPIVKYALATSTQPLAVADYYGLPEETTARIEGISRRTLQRRNREAQDKIKRAWLAEFCQT